MSRKLEHGPRHYIRRDTTLAYSTPQSQEGSDVADSEEKRHDNSLSKSTIDNDHPLPNQSIPLPAISSEIPSLLTDISGANTSLLSETIYDSEKEEDVLKSSNILQSDNTTNQLRSSHQSRAKSGVLKRVNYKNLRRPGKAMLVSHNVFHAKFISQSYIHIV